MQVTASLTANQGVYLYDRVRVRISLAADTSILSVARIQCTPAGEALSHQNQKSRNMWGGETRGLFDRSIFYPRRGTHIRRASTLPDDGLERTRLRALVGELGVEPFAHAEVPPSFRRLLIMV